MHAASRATRAIEALDRAGIAYRLHQYDHDASAASFGEEAATMLGADPQRVLKTLVTSVGPEFVVCLVSVASTLDVKAVAAAVGAKRAEMCDPADAARVTGYIIGAISPIGQKRALPTLMDHAAGAWETVFVSGGRRGLEIELSPSDLLSITAGRTATLARR